MKEQPKLMDLATMRSLFDSQSTDIRDRLFIDGDLAIARGMARLFKVILKQKPPFTIDDYRFGILLSGEIKGTVNLMEKTLSAGTLIFIGPGAVINPTSLSPDVLMHGVTISTRYALPFPGATPPPSFNGQVRDFQLPADPASLDMACRLIDTLWALVHQPNYNRQVASHLVAALMNLYDGLYRQYYARQQSLLSHEQSIFDRFIALVNRHAHRERRLAFYADKMCLTERYLGTVVRQASGMTAKAWIDRATVTRIQVELRHSDKPVAQIADELFFPNPAFFCKYFKRLTGTSPLAYRHSV